MGGGKRSDMVRGVETTGFKTGSRIYCTTQGKESIFCNNCQWKLIFQNGTKTLKN